MAQDFERISVLQPDVRSLTIKSHLVRQAHTRLVLDCFMDHMSKQKRRKNGQGVL